MLAAPPVRDLVASDEAPVPASTLGAPSARVAAAIDALGAFDDAIVVVRGQSFSANLIGRVVFGVDGADHHAVRLAGCECHVHVDWTRAIDVSWGDEDVGYGAEPVVRLLDDRGQPVVRLFYPPGCRESLWQRLAGAVGALDDHDDGDPNGGVDVSGRRVAIVHPAGLPAIAAAERDRRLALLRELGFAPVDGGVPRMPCSAAARAGELAAAIADAGCPIVWASGGGYGSTEVLPFLRDLVPHRTAPTLFVGFSDVSCIGVQLAIASPDVRYVHACNAYDPLLVAGRRDDAFTLFRLLAGQPPDARVLSLVEVSGRGSPSDCSGPIVPVNLSVAGALAASGRAPLPQGSVLFVEDVGDDLHRLLRAVDVLAASSWLAPVSAVVVGALHACTDAGGGPLAPHVLAEGIAARTGKPTGVCAEFGHGIARLPLVMGAPARVAFAEGVVEIGFAP